MTTVLGPLLFIGVLVVFIGLVAWAASRQSRMTMENVRHMAQALGLQFVVKPPALGLFYTENRAAGQVRGKRVELFPFHTGSGKSRTTWCAVSAMVPVAGTLTFHLQQQGFGTKVMELFGAREIQVGDPDFDRLWYIQTNQPEFFREALLPEMRARINALVRDPGSPARSLSIKLEQNMVRYAEIGSFADPNRCERCVRAVEIVCDLADVAEVAAGQPRGN